jgi:hypothetical protein
MRPFKHELNGGDRRTVIGQWYIQAAVIGERLYLRRWKNWMGAAEPHRGDFVNSLWLVHPDGAEECLDAWGWDHYSNDTYHPEPPMDLHPDAIVIEPGSRLEMRSHGATFGDVELFQPVVHLWLYRDSVEARRRYAPELLESTLRTRPKRK